MDAETRKQLYKEDKKNVIKLAYNTEIVSEAIHCVISDNTQPILSTTMSNSNSKNAPIVGEVHPAVGGGVGAGEEASRAGLGGTDSRWSHRQASDGANSGAGGPTEDETRTGLGEAASLGGGLGGPGGDGGSGLSGSGLSGSGLSGSSLTAGGADGLSATGFEETLMEGDWPCSRRKPQDTLGGMENMDVDDGLELRPSRSRLPIYRGPGGTPPSLGKPLTVYRGEDRITTYDQHGTQEQSLAQLDDFSMDTTPGGQLETLLTPSLEVIPPQNPSLGDKAGPRRGGILSGYDSATTPNPPHQQQDISHLAFSSTRNDERDFDMTGQYMEDNLDGAQNRVPPNLALGPPPPVLNRRVLQWNNQGWTRSADGEYLVSTHTGERRKLDPYSRNFWRKQEKNLRRDEERRARQLEEAKKLAAAAQERMEKRKRERSEEASRIMENKKGRHGTSKDHEELGEKEKNKDDGHKEGEKAKEKAEKEAEKAKQREEDAKYWKEDGVEEMTGRIVTSVSGRKMSQVDITLISAEHVKAKREKLVKYGEMQKARNVNSLKIGLGAAGLRIHLAHADGWEWWKELVEGIPPIRDEEGEYSYKFLKPGESAFRYFTVNIPDPELTDREKAPLIFKNELITCEEFFEKFEWKCWFVGSRRGGPRPTVCMRLCVPEQYVDWLLTHNKGCIQYGVERQKLTPDVPDSRPRPARRDGVGAGKPGGTVPPEGARDREDEEREYEEEDDEEVYVEEVCTTHRTRKDSSDVNSDILDSEEENNGEDKDAKATKENN